MDRYKYVVNVEVAVSRGDRFLITVRSDDEAYAPGVLALPGGKVEPSVVTNDVLEGTAKREVYEETGLTISHLAYLESRSFQASTDTFVVDVVFLAEVEPGEAEVKDPLELKDVMWMTPDEILGNPDTPEWLARSIQLARRRVAGRRTSDRSRT